MRLLLVAIFFATSALADPPILHFPEGKKTCVKIVVDENGDWHFDDCVVPHGELDIDPEDLPYPFGPSDADDVKVPPNAA